MQLCGCGGESYLEGLEFLLQLFGIFFREFTLQAFCATITIIQIIIIITVYIILLPQNLNFLFQTPNPAPKLVNIIAIKFLINPCDKFNFFSLSRKIQCRYSL